MASLYVDRKGISIKADGDALAFYEKGKRFQTVPLKLVGLCIHLIMMPEDD